MWRSEVQILTLEGSITVSLDRDSPPGKRLSELHTRLNLPNVRLGVLAYLTFVMDSPIDSVKPRRIINKLLWKLVNDYRGTIAEFSDLADSLLSSLKVGSDGLVVTDESLLAAFKKTPVFREYRYFVMTGDPSVLQYLLSFLTFLKKSGYQDAGLEANALRSWLKVEERISARVLPDWIVNLRKVIHSLFQDFRVGPLFPRHGNGRVAERGVQGAREKNEKFSITPSLKQLYCSNYADYSFSKDYRLFRSYTCDNAPYPIGDSVPLVRDVDLPSRLKFVLKSYKTYRSICMERTPKQWAQQGLRFWYELYLRKTILARFIDIKDQSKNQKLSALGSLTTIYDTIDLSSASDSVGWDLVKAIFPASLLKHLHVTRSSTVELPDGSIFNAVKFAPMGSALCFPIQSTIYAAICLMVGIAQHHNLDWRVPGALDDFDIIEEIDRIFPINPRKLSDQDSMHAFQVYGDDIITDRVMTSNVISALQDAGFEVNIDKSFIGDTPVRESCGKYHYGGYDITPIRYKVKALGEKADGAALSSIVSLANQAYRLGYLALRRMLIRFCLHTPILGIKRYKGRLNPIPFCEEGAESDKPFSIISFKPLNHHLQSRFFKPLWRREVRSLQMVSEKRIHVVMTNYHFLDWQRSRLHDYLEPPQGGSRGVESRGVRVRLAWVAR